MCLLVMLRRTVAVLAMSLLPTPIWADVELHAVCPGDCDQDGIVAIEEVIGIAQGNTACGLVPVRSPVLDAVAAAESASTCVIYVLEPGSTLNRATGASEALSGSFSVVVSTDRRENFLFRMSVADIRFGAEGGSTIAAAETEALGCKGEAVPGCIEARTIPIPFRLSASLGVSIDGTPAIIFGGSQELPSPQIPSNLSNLILCENVECAPGSDVITIFARRAE